VVAQLQDRPTRRWVRLALWSVLLAALVGVAGAAVYQQARRSEGLERKGRASALPVLGQVPDARLTNRDGRAVELAELRGAPWIADFIFTRCQSSCPLLGARMARLDRTLPAAVYLVSFSVDPANDSAPVLAAYARSLAASPRWLFLTGDPARLRLLSRQGFKLALEPGGAAPAMPTEAILHSTRFVLVDARGNLRGFYDALDPAALRRLAADAAALAQEG
jgi:protein SCO1/2